jgi:hypothetical protein
MGLSSMRRNGTPEPAHLSRSNSNLHSNLRQTPTCRLRAQSFAAKSGRTVGHQSQGGPARNEYLQVVEQHSS